MKGARAGRSSVWLAAIATAAMLLAACPAPGGDGRAPAQAGVTPTGCTPLAKVTLEPTSPAATPLPTPAGRRGDANCDGAVNSIDAALILQVDAGLLARAQLACRENADYNRDGLVNSIDAALVLQVEAGLVAGAEAGNWTAGASMPTSRSEVTSAVVDGVIYVVGGLAAAGATDAVEAYDTATDSWSAVTPLPVRLHHTGAAAVDGKVYVVGGYQVSFSQISTATYVYDPVSDAWQSCALMPLERAAAATVAVDDKIYVLGGGGEEPTVPMAYDVATNTWSQLAPMSAAREHLTASVVDGKIYVIGGRWTGVNVDTVEVYDPASDAWQTLSSLPTARGGLASAALGGRIHVVGGEDLSPGGATFPEHEVYDPATGMWDAAPGLPTPRHGLTAQAIGGQVYVIAGGTRPGFSTSSLVEIYEPKPQDFSAILVPAQQEARPWISPASNNSSPSAALRW